jgi:SAM-dependent methyltransferase
VITRWRRRLASLRHPRKVAGRIRQRFRRSVGPGPTEAVYVLLCAGHWLPRAVKAILLRRLGRLRRRTPATVTASYDTVRGRMRLKDFDEFVFGKPNDPEIVLADGHVRWGSRTEVRRIEREHVIEVLADACAGIEDPVVLEVGAGTGANLLLLKRRHPHVHAIGLELSPVSVELAHRAAESFDLDVDMHVADVSRPFDVDLGRPVDVVFSCHALEQMPDVFTGAVDNMLRLARTEAIFFEPVGECYPRNLRGFVGRLRLTAVDYLNGLHKALIARGAVITSIRALGFGVTPFNETVEIRVRTG